jgi:hypothetical protein
MENASGRPLSLHMPLECLNRLAMTLPGMAQQRHRDPTLRVVFPVAQFQVDLASDYATRILTPQTPDGFTLRSALPKSDGGRFRLTGAPIARVNFSRTSPEATRSRRRIARRPSGLRRAPLANRKYT